MKSRIVSITGKMVITALLAASCYNPAFAQPASDPQYPNGPPAQYRAGPGADEHFAEMYRRGYRAGYMAARHNEHYDDRMPSPRNEYPEDRYGYRPDRQNNDGPPR